MMVFVRCDEVILSATSTTRYLAGERKEQLTLPISVSLGKFQMIVAFNIHARFLSGGCVVIVHDEAARCSMREPVCQRAITIWLEVMPLIRQSCQNTRARVRRFVDRASTLVEPHVGEKSSRHDSTLFYSPRCALLNM